jgi:pyruvate dehydrogenase E2 component (dihydrolipoamide acetyltransferase)
MRYIFNFPDIGEGLDEGTIAEWYVEKGHHVESGDSLVKMETDKVVTDIPSPKTGTIASIYGKIGETIKVGSPLVEIEIEGVSGDAAVEMAKEEFKGKSQQAVEEGNAGVVGTLEVAGDGAFLPASEEDVSPSDKQSKKPGAKALATPVARAMAKDLGVDINQIRGTGPGGRVSTSDIKKYKESYQEAESLVSAMPAQAHNEQLTYESLSQIRKSIAKNMINSKHSAAHMTVHDEVEISALVALRNKYKNLYLEKGVKLSYLPFILKAIALALKKYKVLNAQLDMENNRIIYKNYYNIGIAVDTEEGLLVPVIRDIDKLSIFDISLKLNEISEKARKRELTLEDMKGGTFTITNYGSIGGIHAVPVINYPQSGILGIGRLLKKPVVINDEIQPGNVLPLSLSVDHRIVDGGEVTRFLNQVMAYLADPFSLIME